MPKKSQYLQSDSDNEPFLKLGGHPVLDFINTKVIHADSTEDRLDSSQQVELFFKNILQVKVSLSDQDYKNTLNLRKIFREFLEGLVLKQDSESNLKKLNQILSRLSYLPSLRFKNKEALEVAWVPEKKESIQESTLVFQLLNLFDQAELDRLKKCANPNCSHLFYDISKNNTRNWCSMKSCGNIMKARAFYERKKNSKSDSE